MSLILQFVLTACATVVGMILLMEVGRWLGHRRSRRDEEGARAGLGAIEGAVFGLLGLLIAFTFTGAAGRFDHRRDLIAQEVNAIGTAWMRLDLLEDDRRLAMQQKFRDYLDERLAAYRTDGDLEQAFHHIELSQRLQSQIWAEAIAESRTSTSIPIGQVLLPALNEMFDTATLRFLATRTHPPVIMYVMLVAATLLAALMAGYGMSNGRRSWTHIFVFAIIMAGSVYVILDLEFPRVGLVRIDSFDQALVELRASMNPLQQQ